MLYLKCVQHSHVVRGPVAGQSSLVRRNASPSFHDEYLREGGGVGSHRGATITSLFLLRILRKVRSFVGSKSLTTAFALSINDPIRPAYWTDTWLSKVDFIGIPSPFTTTTPTTPLCDESFLTVSSASFAIIGSWGCLRVDAASSLDSRSALDTVALRSAVLSRLTSAGLSTFKDGECSAKIRQSWRCFGEGSDVVIGIVFSVKRTAWWLEMRWSYRTPNDGAAVRPHVTAMSRTSGMWAAQYPYCGRTLPV
ncbi:unnamed protein product, partial [Leptidea sinapis]